MYCPALPLSTPPVMTYAQLESLINKWSLELEDQEKHFLHQATQVNAWDQTLIENGEKVSCMQGNLILLAETLKGVGVCVILVTGEQRSSI